MAATGGPPPPPRGFEDPSSNGNTPPDFDLHIATSSSDALLSSQQNLERLHFLSAKNSVELHKRTIERKHSLPAKFQPDDYARLRHGGEGSFLRAPAALFKKPSNGNPRKNVAWADLNVMSVRSEMVGGNVERNESVERMDVDEPSNDQSKPLKSATEQVRLTESVKKDLVPVGKMYTQDTKSHPIDMLQSVGVKIQSLQDEQLRAEIHRNCFDTTNGPGSRTNIPAGDVDAMLVNQLDNLAPFDPTEIPRVAVIQDETNFNSDSKTMGGGFGHQSPQMTEIPCYPNMGTPTTYLADNARSHRTMLERQKYFDEDDEFIEDEEPKLIIPSANELPTPDPEYVAQNCTLAERALIANVYKKDCRTWLWKSPKQRAAALAKSTQGPSKSNTPGQ